MANALYDAARQLAATTGLDWTGGTVVAYLIDTGAYTYSAAHDFLDDVAVASRIAGPITLTTRVATAGACDADNVTFPAVTGVSIEAVLLVKSTGVEATSGLIAYIDTATGLAITPNSGDIIVTWDNGTNKIFRV